MSPVASLTIGWWPRGDRSWMARRRFPSPTVPLPAGLTSKPPSSGPRCSWASSITRRDRCTCPVDSLPTIPAIPHIRLLLDRLPTIPPRRVVIQGQHLVSHGTPGKFVLHPFSSPAAHILQWHHVNVTNCIGQTLRIIVDPDAAPHVFQAAPWRPLTRNHWNSVGESLRYDDAEVLCMGRYQSNIRTFE